MTPIKTNLNDIQKAAAKVTAKALNKTRHKGSATNKPSDKPPFSPGHPIKIVARHFNEKAVLKLKEIRKEENMTMRALADVIGTPHSFIGKVEKMDRRMDIGEFVVVCRSLNRNPVEVLAAIISSEDSDLTVPVDK